MQAYIVRRLLWAIPTILGAVTILFLVMSVLPGDVAMVILGMETGAVDPVQYEALREELGLNRPLYEQYFSWLWGVSHLDLGTSLWTGRPVLSSITQRLPYTLSIILLASFIIIITSIPVGVLSAVHQDSWLDYTLRSAVIAGISIPNFFLGILILLLAITAFNWSPPLDYATLWDRPWIAIQQLALPAITLGFRAATATSRMVRSTMLEVIGEDYVRTARAKGLSERTVIYIHALRNAILPVVTMFGVEITFMFAGAVVIETVFRIPGIGLLLIHAIQNRDIILVQGIVLIIVVFVLAVNLVMDLLYAWADPRIRYG